MSVNSTNLTKPPRFLNEQRRGRWTPVRLERALVYNVGRSPQPRCGSDFVALPQKYDTFESPDGLVDPGSAAGGFDARNSCRSASAAVPLPRHGPGQWCAGARRYRNQGCYTRRCLHSHDALRIRPLDLHGAGSARSRHLLFSGNAGLFLNRRAYGTAEEYLDGRRQQGGQSDGLRPTDPTASAGTYAEAAVFADTRADAATYPASHTHPYAEAASSCWASGDAVRSHPVEPRLVPVDRGLGCRGCNCRPDNMGLAEEVVTAS